MIRRMDDILQLRRGAAELEQQRTVQAPGGFTDAKAAGNSPRSRGLGRGVAELKSGRSGYEYFNCDW